MSYNEPNGPTYVDKNSNELGGFMYKARKYKISGRSKQAPSFLSGPALPPCAEWLKNLTKFWKCCFFKMLSASALQMARKKIELYELIGQKDWLPAL